LRFRSLGRQVSDTRIVIAVDPPDVGSEELDLPERCRVIKLANSVTYDRQVSTSSGLDNQLIWLHRMDKTLNMLEKTLLPTVQFTRLFFIKSPF
jgi:DNA polymerase alpha-associated DNA helicase A